MLKYYGRLFFADLKHRQENLQPYIKHEYYEKNPPIRVHLLAYKPFVVPEKSQSHDD